MVLVTAAAVLVFSVPLGVAAARIYRDREVSGLEREATKAAGVLPGGGLHSSDTVELPSHPNNVQLALYDEQGVLVAGDGPPQGGSEVFDALAGRINDDHDGAWLAVAIPLHDEEQIVGAARAAIPWSAVTTDTYRSWLIMAALGVVAVGLAAALALRQSRRLVEPIADVARMAVRLGDGDFSAQVAPAGVPELDRAGDALNRTAVRIGEIVARERSFAADVSHQLNTPLTSLRLGLESALLTPDSDIEAALQAAVDEVERLQTTVATLLAVARDGTMAIDAHCDVAVVCSDVADRCRAGLSSAGRPIRIDVDDSIPLVRCPADVLREILAVLVDNAVRHGAGSVTIAGRRAGHGVVVEVTDEGEGVANPASIFERRSPGASGHGIGLSLARSLAEAHESRLQLTRAAPWPVFTLALPGSNDQRTMPQAPSPPRRPPSTR